MSATRLVFAAAVVLLAASAPACGSDSAGSGAPAGASDAAGSLDSGTGQEAGDGIDAADTEETGADIAVPDADWAEGAAQDAAPDADDDSGDSGASPGEDTVDVGGSCQESVECKGDAECVSGAGGTPPYCAPLCTTNTDCVDTVKGTCGMCQSAGSFSFCVFVCGNLAPTFVPECTITPACPAGPLTCDGVFCG